MDSISTDKILGSKKGAIGTLTFNYPEKHNAMSPEMAQAAAAVINDFASDPAVRVVILRAATFPNTKKTAPRRSRWPNTPSCLRAFAMR